MSDWFEVGQDVICIGFGHKVPEGYVHPKTVIKVSIGNVYRIREIDNRTSILGQPTLGLRFVGILNRSVPNSIYGRIEIAYDARCFRPLKKKAQEQETVIRKSLPKEILDLLNTKVEPLETIE